ncbi:hypothetical protein ACSNOF_18365, partial [Streptomyces sp. URMC 125]
MNRRNRRLGVGAAAAGAVLVLAAPGGARAGEAPGARIALPGVEIRTGNGAEARLTGGGSSLEVTTHPGCPRLSVAITRGGDLGPLLDVILGRHCPPPTPTPPRPTPTPTPPPPRPTP